MFFLVLHLRRASLTRAGRVPRTVTCLPASDAYPSRGRCPRNRDRKEKQTDRGADAVLGWPGGCACGCARVAGSVRPGRSHHTGHVHAALAWQTPWARTAGSRQRVLPGKEMLTAPRELPGPDMSSLLPRSSVSRTRPSFKSDPRAVCASPSVCPSPSSEAGSQLRRRDVALSLRVPCCGRPGWVTQALPRAS